MNNGKPAGYRINRKFSSLNQLIKVAYVSIEIVATKIEMSIVPF
jgi:hypothetical protein